MNQVAVLPTQSVRFFTEEDEKILRDSKFRDFNDQQVSYCIKICSLLRLNPILNQIHFVKRKVKNKSGGFDEVITAQTGIDGYRLTAQRAGGYAGSDEPVFEYAPNDQIKKRPIKASVTVYRIVDGQRCAFTASARWDEFYPGPQGEQMWNKMPHNQLAKCAESLALRKACPAELSLVRTDEEMAQADRPDKAGTIQNIITSPKTETEVTSEVSDPKPKLSCTLCGSFNAMKSIHHVNTIYCRDCKKTSPMQS